MVIWQSPVNDYWFCAKELRRGYVNPADRDRYIGILAELARRSDGIGQRAEEVLLELRRKGYFGRTGFA